MNGQMTLLAHAAGGGCEAKESVRRCGCGRSGRMARCSYAIQPKGGTHVQAQ